MSGRTVSPNARRASSTRRGRLARRAAGLTAVLAIVLTVAPSHSTTADATVDPGWQISPTSPTTNLVDGQRLLINVKSTRADVSVNEIEIHECRFDATYTTVNDINPDTGKCPPRAVSTSADYLVDRGASSGLTTLAKTPSGDNVPFIVGQGVVEWTSATKHTLTCDPTTPCALVMKVSIGSAAGPSVVFQTLKLSFADDNPLAACGGFAKGSLNTGGSDEISDAWAQWTRAECVSTGKGAPTKVSFPGEGPSVALYGSGGFDLVYTAAGYDSAVGLGAGAVARPSVAVPIAVNASVIAAGGGQHQLVNGSPIGDKARYPDGSLELTAGEVGALLGGGQSWISRFDLPYQGDILARNPALQEILYDPNNGIYAPSESLASSWYMTNYLATLAPADFVRPVVSPPERHGPVASLALSNPAFDQINLYTGRPGLAKTTVPAESTGADGPIWTMTDLSSARALDLTPVALQSGAGFVAPTPASMNAALAAMKPDVNGMLVPDPALATTTVAAGAVQPYPLTYVVYALVPAQPLVDASTCQLRSDSQLQLVSWLQYLTGAGQDILPAGMQPLPTALQDQAKLAIAQVGVAKVTGSCAGKQHTGGGGGKGTGAKKHNTGGGTGSTTTTTTIPAGSNFVPSTSGSFSSASGTGGIPKGSLLPPTTIVRATNAKGSHKTRAAQTGIRIPGFAGHRVAGSWGGLVALLGIAALMSLAAALTARSILGRRGGGAVVTAVPASIRPTSAPTVRRVGLLAGLWLGVAAVSMALVVFALGPMLQQRDQRALLSRYRVTVSNAANELQGLPGVSEVTDAPQLGSPVGIIEIGALRSQDVVVEGVGAAQTSQGPGHVPGTAGLGQPGNAVVVARHNGFGGAFAHIGDLHPGDPIVVTTTQGQSLYNVTLVHHVSVTGGAGSPQNSELTSSGSSPAVRLVSASGAASAAKTSLDALYGPSDDDRLTLVTSSSRAPWDTSNAIEVVARLAEKPFPPTPQQARSATETGTHGDHGTLPAVVLALLAFAAAIAGSVVLYHTLRFRTAYLLSIAPLVAITVITGETIARLLPAWT